MRALTRPSATLSRRERASIRYRFALWRIAETHIGPNLDTFGYLRLGRENLAASIGTFG